MPPNPIRAVRSLANFLDDATGAWRLPWRGKADMLEVDLAESAGYPARTVRNASESDVTISVARDRDTRGEVLTRNAVARAKKRIVEVPHSSETFDADVESIVQALNEVSESVGGRPIVINTAGNALNSLQTTQDAADDYALRILDSILDSPNRRFEVERIRSGGQTGYDIAFIKAALARDIPAKIHAARGRKTGGFMLRRETGTDAELAIEDYLVELGIDQQSVDRLVERVRAAVPEQVRASLLPRPKFRSEMKFKDGDRGLRMLPKFSGESTMDLIMSGNRTATSRPASFLRSARKGTVVEFYDEAGRTALVRITSNPKAMEVPDDPEELARLAQEWSSKEGWAPEMYESLARKGYQQYEYELLAVNGSPVQQRQVKRVELGGPTPEQIEAEKRRLSIAAAAIDPKTGRVDPAKQAILEEQQRRLGITETERRRVEVEKGEQSRGVQDVERERRRAIENLRRRSSRGTGMESVTLDDIAREAPELLDDRPTFDMDVQMDIDTIDGLKNALRSLTPSWNYSQSAAVDMPPGFRFKIDDEVLQIFEDQFIKDWVTAERLPRFSSEAAAKWGLPTGDPLVSRGETIVTSRNLRDILSRIMRDDSIPQSIKDKIKVSDYYSAVAMADTYFPVVRVAMPSRTMQITGRGFERVESPIPITTRIPDKARFAGASPYEMRWLDKNGKPAMDALMRVISGDFATSKEKTMLITAARRLMRSLMRVRDEVDSPKSAEIDEFFKYLFDKANAAESRYTQLPKSALARPEATRFQDPKSKRIFTNLFDKNGNAREVEFLFDETSKKILLGKYTVDGEPMRSLDLLDELLEMHYSYLDLDDAKIPDWYSFDLGIHKADGSGLDTMLGRKLSWKGIVFDDGETLLDKFVRDVLGYREDSRTVQQILFDAQFERPKPAPRRSRPVKIDESKLGPKPGETNSQYLKRIARETDPNAPKPKKAAPKRPKKEPAYIPRTTPLLQEAKNYEEELVDLVRRALDEPSGTNLQNLEALAAMIGNRKLTSHWDVNFWGRNITPAHALTRILDERGLRPSKPKRTRTKAGKVTEAPEDMPPLVTTNDLPPDPSSPDEEVWQIYAVGEVVELPGSSIENALGVKRLDIPDEDFLTNLEVPRAQQYIVERELKGRKARAAKPIDEEGYPITLTESQRKGRVVAKTEEERALARFGMTDEYGFSVLMQGDDTVDILRKPGSNRNFGNPYPIDDNGNIAQRVLANIKFEDYLLNGKVVEEFNSKLGRIVTYDHASFMRRNLWKLRGKKLSCVCGPKYCHGEVLATYANSPEIGALIEKYGDDVAGLSDAVEWQLREWGKATRIEFQSFISRYIRQYRDYLVTLPDEMSFRIGPDDLFIERISPRTDIGQTEDLL